MAKDIYMPREWSRPDDWEIYVIGAGGNGSHFLKAFASFDYFNKNIRYSNFKVHVYDDDVVEDHNTGRQAFNKASIGRNKAENMCSKINMNYGFAYKSYAEKFTIGDWHPHHHHIYVLAVDDPKFRLEFYKEYGRAYIIDLGNGDDFGQVSFYYGEQCYHLPEFRSYFKSLRVASENKTPSVSCSHIDSVRSQGLFVNSQMALMSATWLYNIFMYNPTEIPIRAYFNSKDMVMTNLTRKAQYEQRIDSPLI